MHTKSRQFTILGVCALSGMLIISGCATKKYVREQTGAIDTKLTGVSGKLTEVENRARENAERIDGVDKRAQPGITDAATAHHCPHRVRAVPIAVNGIGCPTAGGIEPDAGMQRQMPLPGVTPIFGFQRRVQPVNTRVDVGHNHASTVDAQRIVH